MVQYALLASCLHGFKGGDVTSSKAASSKPGLVRSFLYWCAFRLLQTTWGMSLQLHNPHNNERKTAKTTNPRQASKKGNQSTAGKQPSKTSDRGVKERGDF